MATLDFPPSPAIGQKYTSPDGIVYEWNGQAWFAFYDPSSGGLTLLGDLINRIRTLLQDTDQSSGVFRYMTDSIVANINMGMIEMYKIRPDIFLENGFAIPQFSPARPDAALVIEKQYVPALVYYATGLSQMRDDEETQDQRAGAFYQRFVQMLTTAA